MIDILLLILLGSVTGILSGYLGIGGGIVVVPVLTEIFINRRMPIDQVMTVAFATSLFQAVFTTGSSAWRQWRQDNLLMKAVPIATGGAIIGSQLGAYLGSRLQGGVLMVMFGGFLLLAAINLAVGKPKHGNAGEIRFPTLPLLTLGLITGVVSALFGIGGGILMVPVFILLFRYPSGKVAGTSSAIGFLTTISGVVGYLLYGAERAGNTAGFVGVIDLSVALPIALGTLICAPIGAKWNKKFGGAVYQKIFAVFLIVIALRMLIRAL